MVVNCGARRTRMGSGLIALAVIGMLLLACAGRASAALSPPTSDPFYTQPANIASYANGAIIRTREVGTHGDQANVSAATYQLMYRTTNATGQPVAAVTTLLIPSTPAAGPRRLASYQTAYDSLSLSCAPSYTLQGGNGGGGDTASLETTFIAAELAQGWDVNVPDYEGLDSDWVVGPMIGHAVLDSIKADEAFASSQLEGTSTEVTVNGYSGGSEATTWAAALAPSYAPTLDVVGAAAGGNFPDLDYTLSQFDDTLWYGTEIGVLTSFNRAFPQLHLSSFLNAAGLALSADDGRDASGCGGSTLNETFGNATQYTTFPSSAAMAVNPTIKTILGYGSLENGPWTTVPMYLYNGQGDELAHIVPVNQWVGNLCAHGVRVDYDSDPLGQEHIQAIVRYWPAALAYLEARFAGESPPDSCPAGSPASVTPAPTVTPAACLSSSTLSGSHVGPVRLGSPGAQLRRRVGVAPSARGAHSVRYCSGSSALYAGTATVAERRSVSASVDRALSGRVVWALTPNPAYAIDGVQAAEQVSASVLTAAGWRVVTSHGTVQWYARPGRSVTGVIEVSASEVQLIGLATPKLTRSRRAETALFNAITAGV